MLHEFVTHVTNWWQLRSQLDDAIASECPFCGDLMIREISLPFILPDEDQHVLSWEIKPNVGSQRNIPLSVWFAVWKISVHLCTINTVLCSVFCCDISIHFIFEVTIFLFILRWLSDCHRKYLYPNPYCKSCI